VIPKFKILCLFTFWLSYKICQCTPYSLYMIAHPFLPSLPPPAVLLKQDYTFRNLSWKPFIILQAILLLIFCMMKYYWSSNKFLLANNPSYLIIKCLFIWFTHQHLQTQQILIARNNCLQDFQPLAWAKIIQRGTIWSPPFKLDFFGLKAGLSIENWVLRRVSTVLL